jgi:hypothetical protein
LEPEKLESINSQSRGHECVTAQSRRVTFLRWHSVKEGEDDRTRTRDRSASHARRPGAGCVALGVRSPAARARPRAVPPASPAEERWGDSRRAICRIRAVANVMVRTPSQLVLASGGCQCSMSC